MPCAGRPFVRPSARTGGIGLGSRAVPNARRIGRNLGSELWPLAQPELVKAARVRVFMDAVHDEIKALRPRFEGRQGG